LGAPEEGRNKGAPAVDDNGSEYGGTPAMAFKTARKEKQAACFLEPV